MAQKRPLTLYGGRIEELRAADHLPASALLPRVWRNGAYRVFGAVAASNLGTLALTASRLYFLPFAVSRAESLTELGLRVSTASAGSASIGIYANADTADGDGPGALLASVTGLNTGTTGFKSAALGTPLDLLPGVTYWAALISSAAATLNAVTSGHVMHYGAGSTTATIGLFAAGSGSTLPDPAPTSLTNHSTVASTPLFYYLCGP